MIRNKKNNPRISSALKAVDLKQQPAPLIIGERLNTQGSKKAKEMVLNNDFDGLLDVARRQVEDGAHCLDVCVATTERSDELEFMRTLVKRLSLEIDAPLAIDSTDPKVIQAAIRQIPGKPIINSINLEGDGTRFHLLAPLMVKYGVPAIAMCIGPRGMAKTSQEKLDTALLLLETGKKKYGLQSWQFIFDVLTFTLATGEAEFLDSAKATLEGIRLVKRNIPDSFTTLGLSNISFGLPLQARKIINSVFLYYAVKSGLDSVIINAKDIIPYTDIDPIQRNLAESLIFNKHSNALSDLISYFQKSGISLSATSSTKNVNIDPKWDPSKKSYFRIVNRLKEGIESDVVSAIAMRVTKNSSEKAKVIHEKKPFPQQDENNDQREINTPPDAFSEGIEDPYQVLGNVDKEEAHQAAVQTLNEVLLPAMKEVGDKFGAGELILPFVLKSAECMKAAVAELEKYLIKQEGVSKGKLVLCTVYGDVHDIGKNLVKTIFVNNGYTVYDLGKQVPIQKIVEKVEEVNADAVGLSALLVSTSKQMQYFIDHARKNKIQIPVLCGGAAINSNYINRIAKDKQSIYSAGVFYCKTAFDGLRIMNKLMSEEKNQFISAWYSELEEWEARIQQRNLEYDNATQRMRDGDTAKSHIVPVVVPPTPPHINERVRLDASQIDLNEVWKYINKKSLFVLSWGIRGKAAQALVKTPDLLLEEWKQRVLKENLFEQSIVYGYFRCHNIKNKLIVDTPENEQVIFDFPRSSQKKHLCLTDYFGKDDIVAFQAVTVGNKVTNIISDWNKAGSYTDAYYLHGLAVETAEALAEWVNIRIKRELKINHKGGLRYSWGYPSCPDISQHKLVWKILDPTKSGMTLTEMGQIIPDQSTAAIIVHHPDAEYFVL